MENITSEQELKQLLDEGKINEDEYQDLLGTMQRKPQINSSIEAPTIEPVRTSSLAIASIVMALVLGPFGILPAIICGHVALRKIERNATLRGRGLAIAGLIAGYSILGLTLALSVPILLPLLAYQRAAVTVDAIEIKRFALDDKQNLITQSGVNIDKQISSDGNGSLRIETTGPTTIRLFETGDLDIDNVRLIYQAKVRTENAMGRVYLEMWCHLPGKGEYFSKGLTSPMTGTMEWTTLETPFFLKKGENPNNIKLNLVIEGSGTAWIDDIRLLEGPLK